MSLAGWVAAGSSAAERRNTEFRIQNPESKWGLCGRDLYARAQEYRIQTESKWGAVGRDLYARAQESRIQNPESRIQNPKGGVVGRDLYLLADLGIQEYRIQNFLIWIRLTAYCTFTLR